MHKTETPIFNIGDGRTYTSAEIVREIAFLKEAKAVAVEDREYYRFLRDVRHTDCIDDLQEAENRIEACNARLVMFMQALVDTGLDLKTNH